MMFTPQPKGQACLYLVCILRSFLSLCGHACVYVRFCVWGHSTCVCIYIGVAKKFVEYFFLKIKDTFSIFINNFTDLVMSMSAISRVV